MKPRLHACASILCCCFFAQQLIAQAIVPGYTSSEIAGFAVLTKDQDVLRDPFQMQAALSELRTQLEQVVNLPLRPQDLGAFLDVKVFIDLDKTNGGAVYHPSRAWLLQNGYIPEKERSVEISNATNFVNWSQQNQPWIVLHELAHAYHDQILGFNYPDIQATYANALTTGIYDSVDYNPGFGFPYIKLEAYAKTNAIEYFAEITEAYFGQNDYYPFNRSDLQTHDPQGYALLEQIWGTGTSTSIAPPALPTAIEVYPNPVRNYLTLLMPEAHDVLILDVLGREVRSLHAPAGRFSIDLSKLPAGIYFIHLSNEETIQTYPIIRIE